MANLSIAKILNASESAAKSFLGVSNVTHSVITNNYRGGVDRPFGNSGWLFNMTGGGRSDIHFNFDDLESVIAAYEKCAPVYSIVNKQAYAYTNGKAWILDEATKKESTSPFAGKVKALLNHPNILQNGKQFKAQMAIYLRLFGYCVLLPIKPRGFPMSDSKALWIIPPYMCKFNWAKETFFNLKKGIIQSVVVKYGTEETTLMPEDIIVLKDITPGFDTPFLPASPIKPLAQNISNLIGIYESKGVLINYRGALGILSPQIDPQGAIAMDPEEKKDLQDSLGRYGIRNGQWKFIVSNSSMQWQQMGVPYRDLMLTEWTEDDTMAVCDGLNYPYKLLANQSSSSMNGTEVGEYKKNLYQDFVMPFAEMIDEQLGEAFEMKENGCCLNTDYSHVPVLQEDNVKNATARLLLNQALKIEHETGLLTINQWLIKLGEDPIGPQGDIRAINSKGGDAPLASIIGVGGVQSLLEVLTAAGLSDAARSATIQIVFGISPENAAAMTTSAPAATTTAPAATA